MQGEHIAVNVNENMKLFVENYTILFDNLEINEEFYLGSKINKYCRYCGKTENEVAFNNTAHAIPHSIGNKYLIDHNECDECNKFFSENLEVHFDKVSRVFRTIGQIKGKKRKVPGYVAKNQKSRIRVSEYGFEVRNLITDPIIEINEENKTVTMEFEFEPYVKTAVYKTYVKMALALMPLDELKHFEHAIKWILEKDHGKSFMQPLMLLRTFIPGPKPIPKPIVCLYKKITSIDYPSYIFVLNYGNIIDQVIVPTIIDNDTVSTLNISKLFCPFELPKEWSYGSLKHSFVDLADSSTTRNEKFEIVFGYERKEDILIITDETQ